MSNLNVTVLEGHLVKNAELGYFSDQSAYCNFSIANNESYKNQNGEYENIPSFFDCSIKGKYAETMCKNLLKGRGITIVGRLKQSRWEKDGQKYSRVYIKVQEIHLSPMAATNGGTASHTFQPMKQQDYYPENLDVDIGDDEPEFIPF